MSKHVLEALDLGKVVDKPDYSFVEQQAALLLQRIAEGIQEKNKKAWWLHRKIERCQPQILPMAKILINDFVSLVVYSNHTNSRTRVEVRRTWPYVAMHFPITEIDTVLKCMHLLHRTQVPHQLFVKEYLGSKKDVRVMPEDVKETLSFKEGRLIVKLESKKHGTKEAVL